MPRRPASRAPLQPNRSSIGTFGLEPTGAREAAFPDWGNPQSPDSLFDRRRRPRLAWLRSTLGSLAGSGQMPSADDFAELPAALLDPALALCKRAVAAFRAGEQATARAIVEEGLFELEQQIPRDWAPPAQEGPSPELLDKIRGRFA